jgi:hypothetical protein
MRRALVLVPIVAAGIFALGGCNLLGGGVTLTGTVSGDYFDILGDVTVTITRGDESFSMPVPLAGSYIQVGSFLFANVPAGGYAVEVSFEAGHNFIEGTQYRIDGGAWMPVDDETVTGTSVPYTFSIVIDDVEGGVTLDLNFGDAE